MAKVTRKRKRTSNPARRVVRRRKATATRRRRRTVMNPAPRQRRRRMSARRNPGMRRRAVRRMRTYRRYSNPSLSGFGGLAKDALAVIGGAVGSKYLTQLVLAGNNTSYVGYAGNLAATLLLGYGVGHLLKDKKLAHMVMIGGATALALRILQDQTPLGQYVNLSLSGMGKGGDLGLGAIEDSSFSTPVTWPAGKMSGNGQVPNYLVQAPVAPVGMKGLGVVTRNARRSRGRI